MSQRYKTNCRSASYFAQNDPTSRNRSARSKPTLPCHRKSIERNLTRESGRMIRITDVVKYCVKMRDRGLCPYERLHISQREPLLYIFVRYYSALFCGLQPFIDLFIDIELVDDILPGAALQKRLQKIHCFFSDRNHAITSQLIPISTNEPAIVTISYFRTMDHGDRISPIADERIMKCSRE